ALASLGFMSSFWASLRLDMLNRERLWAIQECRKQIEIIESTPFQEVQAKHGQQFRIDYDINGDGVAGPLERLQAAPDSLNIDPDKAGVIIIDPAPGVATLTFSGANANTGDFMCLNVTARARWLTGTGGGGSAKGDVIQLFFTTA